jgi:glyoxylase-like metal-dependent hydrolase (beta-lactamase superfamily II)
MREKATFFKDNILPLQEAGQLYCIDKDQPSFENIEFLLADGHTEKMLMPKINYQGQTVLFVADTIPSAGHIPVPYVMGYDIRPLQTMEEKTSILSKAAEEKWVLFFDHDPNHDCATVVSTEKGFKIEHTFPLTEL